MTRWGCHVNFKTLILAVRGMQLGLEVHRTERYLAQVAMCEGPCLNLLYFCFISAVLLAISLEFSDDNVSPHPVLLTTTLLSDTAQTKSDPYSIPC